MNIVFRADANSSIGMGHIMRSLSIADAFSDKGHLVSFVLADDTVEKGVSTTQLIPCGSEIVCVSLFTTMQCPLSSDASPALSTIGSGFDSSPGSWTEEEEEKEEGCAWRKEL